MRDLSFVEAQVCFTLYRQGCFGNGHRLVDTIVNGFPSRVKGEAKDAIASLLRDGILQRKASKHGPAIFIPAKLAGAVRDRIIQHDALKWLPR